MNKTDARLARAAAIARGEKTYHGKACPICGGTLRRISGSGCVVCGRAQCRAYSKRNRGKRSVSLKKWKTANGDRVRAYRAKHYAVNKKKQNAQARAWAKANSDRRAALQRAWVAKNPAKAKEIDRRKNRKSADKIRARAAAWYKANPVRGKFNAKIARGRRRQRIAKTVLAVQDRRAIRAIYHKAQAEGLHVDHIVPLAGCVICGEIGIHVPANLQLLDQPTNQRKGQKCGKCFVTHG